MLDFDYIEGHNIRFRLVMPQDAEYVQRLRTNPAHGRHLSAPAPSVEGQRAWIESYKMREAVGREYYFVIERRDNGQRCGVVRLYDIASGCFTWGSWILDLNKPPKAALDSALLIYRFGFEKLGCSRAEFDVRRENERTLAFHRRFGAVETGSDELNVYFKIQSDEFERKCLALEGNFNGSEG